MSNPIRWDSNPWDKSFLNIGNNDKGSERGTSTPPISDEIELNTDDGLHLPSPSAPSPFRLFDDEPKEDPKNIYAGVAFTTLLSSAEFNLWKTKFDLKEKMKNGQELDDSFEKRLDELEAKIDALDKKRKRPPTPPEDPEEPELPKFSPSGLRNVGLTCWMNAFLQSIAHSPSRYYDAISRDETAAIVSDLRSNNQISQESLKQCAEALFPNETGRQLDAHEAITKLSSRYGVTLATPKKELISRFSDGTSFTTTDNADLRLNANQEGQTTTELLQHYFAEEQFDPNRTDLIRYVATDASNRIVTVVSSTYGQLQRGVNLSEENLRQALLSADVSTTHVNKVNIVSRKVQMTETSDQVQMIVNRGTTVRAIDVQEEIDLGSFLPEVQQKRYCLDQVIVHSGNNVNDLSHGHYIAICRNPSGGWDEYDDSFVTHFTSFAAVKRRTLDTNGYVFVYSKIS